MSYVNTATQDAARRIDSDPALHAALTRWVCKGVKTYKQFCELLGVEYGTVDGYALLADLAHNLLCREEISMTRFNKVMDYLNANTYDTAYLAASEALARGETISQSKEDNDMKFETKHFINGTNVNDLSIDQRINLIRDTEKRTAELRAVATQSALVASEIAKAEAFLTAIVAQFDANVG